MAFDVTQNTLFATQKNNLEPQIVFEVDGYAPIFGSSSILKLIRIGDEDLFIDGTWVIGGSRPIKNQKSLISFGQGGGQSSTTKITQQLSTDTGASSGITSASIVLIDKDEQITRLITPGLLVEDMLARRCKIWLGFSGTNFKEDFVIIHRGIVDDIIADPGLISFNISHPDQKKRQDLFTTESTTLTATITAFQTTIPCTSLGAFFAPIVGPSGGVDPDLETLVQIDDEIIKYTGISGGDLTGCIRAYLGTAPAVHTLGATVDSCYQLSGNTVKLAEKLMLSGWNGPCFEDIAATRFNQVTSDTNVQNGIFLSSFNLLQDYGLSVGDYVSVTGAVEAANNFTNRKILEISTVPNGSYIVIDGADLTLEVDSPALLDIRSQFDVWPFGLRMVIDEVDVTEHEKIYRLFLSSFDQRFFIKDSITGKDFIEKQLLKPAAAFTIPRNSQASIGYHIGPIPSSKVKTIDPNNIRGPKDIRVRRGLSKNFYNTVVYRFDKNTDDVYKGGVVSTSQTSRDRIDVGTRPLVIDADGMRTDLFAFARADQAATRRLNRYKFGAEYIDNLKLMFSEGYNIDVGDIVLADFSTLNVVNTTDGNRAPQIKFYEVQNKSLDLKTGDIAISLTDTNFSTASRYGLISPSSYIKTVGDQRTFVIESSFSSVYGVNEGRKWSRYIGEAVRIRASDYSQFESAIIKSVSGNTVTLETPLVLSYSAGFLMELDTYNNQSLKMTLLYAFMRDSVFDDGKPQYVMI